MTSSHLGGLPEETLGRLLSRSAKVSIPRGSITHHEGDPTAHFELVVSGVVRVYVMARDGRTMTIRYCRPGDLIGVMSIFASAFSMPANTQALVDTVLLRLSPSVASDLSRDPRVARAFLTELSERGQRFVREIPGGAFSTVRERVARHLLDLASEAVRRGSPEAQQLVVSVTQQDLADAVGTVREVVVKVIRQLRKEAIVRTERGAIILLDPERLVAERSGTWIPDNRVSL